MNFESIKRIVVILMGINVIYIIMGWLDITKVEGIGLIISSLICIAYLFVQYIIPYYKD